MINDIQKQKIIAMRAAGYGYKKIAAELGLNRDIVRYFCKNTDIEVKTIVKKVNPNYCEQCNKYIQQPTRGRRRRFCCDDCRRSWWKEHPEAQIHNSNAVYIINCVGCGQEFESYGNKLKRYCIHNCYINKRFGETK